jgi:hypothetical protein
LRHIQIGAARKSVWLVVRAIAFANSCHSERSEESLSFEHPRSRDSSQARNEKNLIFCGCFWMRLPWAGYAARLTGRGSGGIGLAVRRFTLLTIAAFVLVGLLGAFGCCTFACDEGDDHAGNADAACCVAQCVCHSVSLTSQPPVALVASWTAHSYRWFDERLPLPLFVADIFNPPKA